MRGNFPISKAELYQATGYIPICNKCVDQMYKGYLAECGNEADAIRQLCRVLNLFYSDKVFESAVDAGGAKPLVFRYLAKVKDSRSYTDTLAAEGKLWDFRAPIAAYTDPEEDFADDAVEDPVDDIPEEWKDMWGPDHDRKTYEQLQKKFAYHSQKMIEDKGFLDHGTETLLKQMCILEVEIASSTGSGKGVEKNINALNNLIGSLDMKPSQKKTDYDKTLDKTPLGVWIQKWENERPIPEPDPDFANPDKIVKYMHTFYLGHLTKMLGIKNRYTEMYEEEMNKYRVERPEFDGDTDEELFFDIFNDVDIDD